MKQRKKLFKADIICCNLWAYHYTVSWLLCFPGLLWVFAFCMLYYQTVEIDSDDNVKSYSLLHLDYLLFKVWVSAINGILTVRSCLLHTHLLILQWPVTGWKSRRANTSCRSFFFPWLTKKAFQYQIKRTSFAYSDTETSKLSIPSTWHVCHFEFLKERWNINFINKHYLLTAKDHFKTM